MKKIPTKINICGAEYQVIQCLVCTDVSPGSNCWGFIDFEHLEIRLFKGLAHEKKWQVLMHEVIHGIDEATGIELSEEDTDRIAISMVDTLVRNSLGLL